MNKNYQIGVRLERDIIDFLKKKGYFAARSAGSHSSWDVFAWSDNPIIKPCFIQAKRVTTPAQAKLLIKKFNESHTPSLHFHKQLVVKVKGTSGWEETTI